jgi:HPt (histidine-containing phosphotransfer) domain-containing protein
MLRRWIQRAAVPGEDQAAPAGAPSRVQSSVEALSEVDAAAVAALRSLRAGGSGDLYCKLVDLFRVASTEALAQVKSALEANDLAAAAGVCHKLASSAANVGALAFARSARQLEAACEAADAPEARRLCDRLTGVHPTLIGELARYQLRASA